MMFFTFAHGHIYTFLISLGLAVGLFGIVFVIVGNTTSRFSVMATGYLMMTVGCLVMLFPISSMIIADTPQTTSVANTSSTSPSPRANRSDLAYHNAITQFKHKEHTGVHEMYFDGRGITSINQPEMVTVVASNGHLYSVYLDVQGNVLAVSNTQ